MSAARSLTILIALSALTTGSAGCFLQPVTRVEREFNFVDYDAPALRLERPVKAYLLEKRPDGTWRSIGKGLVPAGAYIKGRAPVPASPVAPAPSAQSAKSADVPPECGP